MSPDFPVPENNPLLELTSDGYHGTVGPHGPQEPIGSNSGFLNPRKANSVMAKKSAVKSDGEKEVTLKLRLTPAEHKDVRMAAAEREMTISEFLRESVLACAGVAVEKYYQRELAPKKSSRRSKSEDK